MNEKSNITKEIANHIQITVVYAGVSLLGMQLANSVHEHLLSNARELIAQILLGMGAVGLLFHWIDGPISSVQILLGCDTRADFWEELDDTNWVFLALFYLVVFIEIAVVVLLFFEVHSLNLPLAQGKG